MLDFSISFAVKLGDWWLRWRDIIYINTEKAKYNACPYKPQSIRPHDTETKLTPIDYKPALSILGQKEKNKKKHCIYMEDYIDDWR